MKRKSPSFVGFHYYMKPQIYCQFDDKSGYLYLILYFTSIVPNSNRNYNDPCLHHGSIVCDFSSPKEPAEGIFGDSRASDSAARPRDIGRKAYGAIGATHMVPARIAYKDTKE